MRLEMMSAMANTLAVLFYFNKMEVRAGVMFAVLAVEGIAIL